ncbi:hypothetical protein ACHAW5_006067 [Stephanodiscus triporus]|uniref:Uncharacterized protein n=1 Tax=Stephanodiscus triporus TaxID=2934178 RepID=A0ABD3QGX7_9STRA
MTGRTVELYSICHQHQSPQCNLLNAFNEQGSSETNRRGLLWRKHIDFTRPSIKEVNEAPFGASRPRRVETPSSL